MSVRRIAQRLPKLVFPPASRPTNLLSSRATSSSSPSLDQLASTSSSSSSSTPSSDATLLSSSTLVPPPAPTPRAPKVKATKAEKAANKKAAASKVAKPVVVAPPVIEDLRLGTVGPIRYQDFYHNSLADDLLYLAYSHRLAIDPELPAGNLSAFQLDPTNPYAINARHPKPKGRRATIIPVHKAVTARSVPRLEGIVLNCNVAEAIGQKAQLLGAIHMLRTITSQVEGHRGVPTAQGVQINYAKMGVASWGVREGMATGCRIKIEGDEMWRFLETLTEFVFPRLREWKGLKLPQIRGEDRTDESATAGAISMGLAPPAMALFPQIEACLDAYPRMYGMNITFLTNQRGLGAADRSRALLSGFRVPFERMPYVRKKAVAIWKKGKRLDDGKKKK